jgi:radical SAM protein with 4Fe4S-binding SPASM domain
MSVKQKFIDPVIKKKAKEVANIQYTKDGRPLPAIVEISESGTCNRTCSFCPRSDPSWKDIKEFISDEMVNKLCDELAEFDYHGLIIISGFVEPLLDKNIYNIINKFRTKLPKSKIEITTNGDVLNIKRIKKLFESGLTSFYISVYDGPEDEEKFIKMCKDAGIPEEKYKIRARYLPETKDFGITLANRGGMMENAEYNIPSLSEPLNKPCYYPSYNFFLDYTGDVLVCSHDWGKKQIVGNFNKEKLIDIWFGEKFLYARRKLSNSDRTMDPCNKCDVIGTLLGESNFKAWKKFL